MTGTNVEEPAVTQNDWQRFSAFTPWFSVVKLWGWVFVALVAFGRDNLEQGVDKVQQLYLDLGWAILGWVFLGLLAVSFVSVVIAAAIWLTTRFALVADGIHVRRGILAKKHTHLRWDRVQTVEIDTRFIARIFGYAQITIDSGGGIAADNVVLGMLKRDECNALRNSLLAAADAARAGEPVVITPWRGEHALAAMNDVDAVYRVSTGMLIGSLIRSNSLVVGIVSVVFSVLALVIDHKVEGAGFSAIPLLLIIVGSVWSGVKRVAQQWDATVHFTRDGIRSTAGAFGVTQRTVLPDRIVAISIKQPLLWRRKDWWKLEIATVGEKIDTDNRNLVIMPVASRRDVVLILWSLVADLGVEDQDALLAEVFDGEGDGRYVTNASRNARFLDPWGWKRNGFALTESFLVLRWGKVFGRRIQLCLNERFQGITTESGPLKRRWDLASLQANIPALNVAIRLDNMDREVVESLRQNFAEAGRRARAQHFRETVEQWRVRVDVAEATNRGAEVIAQQLSPHAAEHSDSETNSWEGNQ